MKHRTVAINEKGLRIGQDHPQAKLTDGQVALIRQLHGEGMGYAQLAEKFEVSHHTIGRICRFEIRAQTVARHKPLPVRLMSLFEWYATLKTCAVQGELQL